MNGNVHGSLVSEEWHLSSGVVPGWWISPSSPEASEFYFIQKDMIPIEQQLKTLLEDNGVESDVAETFIANFNKSKETDPLPDEEIPALETQLLDETDWRRRAVLAARIISKRYDIGY